MWCLWFWVWLGFVVFVGDGMVVDVFVVEVVVLVDFFG